MAIADTVGGLVPYSGPITVQHMVVGGTDVKRGSLVKLSSGDVIPAAAADTTRHGVALCHGTEDDVIPISVNPATIYECDFNDTYVEATHVGKVADVTTESATGDWSNQKVDYTDGTIDTAADFIIVGNSGKVDDANRVLVRVRIDSYEGIA